LTVPAGTLAAINLIWLAAGLALVLWGLRIFRLWVGAVGFIGGGAIGAAIGAAMGGREEMAVIGGLAGGVVGAVVAWPLQRLTVSLAAGMTTALIAAAGAMAFAGSEYVAGAAILGFLAGGAVAFVLYETVIITAMAFTGAHAVFHALYVPADAWLGTPEQIGARILAIYAAELVVFVALTVVFVAFSMWYQRGPAAKRERSPGQAAWARAAKQVSTRLAFVVLAAWAVSAFFVAARVWPMSMYDLAGMHPLTWPIVAIAVLALLVGRPRTIGYDIETGPPPAPRGRRRRFLRTAAICALVPPVLTAAVFVALGGSWEGLASYYRAFLAGPAPVVAAKWAFSLGLMPLLLARPNATAYVPIEPVPVDPPEEDVEDEPEEEASPAGLEDDPSGQDVPEDSGRAPEMPKPQLA
jgi:hypothetical protein